VADNIELNAGSGGATLATDDLAGVHYQVVKLAVGADGVADFVSNSAPIPVSDAGGSITVDGTFWQATQPVSNAGTFAVQAAQSGTWNITNVSGTVSLPTGASTSANQTTIIGHLDGVEGLLTTIDADTSTLAGTVSGSEVQVDIVGALPAGTNAIGKLAANSGVDIGDVDVTSIAAGSNLIGNVGIGVRTSGGTSIFRSLDLDETEEEIKGSAGQVYWIHCINLASSKRYLKFYDATAASVTVGTTTPVLTFVIPTQGDTNGTGFVLTVPMGIPFATAITAAATTGLADNDTGAPSANDVVINVGYA
jgi:hypothetical protein